METDSKLLNCDAMDAYESRRAWLRELLARYENQADLAKSCGMKPPYLSQLLAGPPPAGRNMGDKWARRLEAWAGHARGTFDRPPTALDIGVRDGDSERLMVDYKARLREAGRIAAEQLQTIERETKRLSGQLIVSADDLERAIESVDRFYRGASTRLQKKITPAVKAKLVCAVIQDAKDLSNAESVVNAWLKRFEFSS